MSVYNYTVLDSKGVSVSLADYREKVILIVNTATKCGFTPQYKGLEELYQKYKNKGFEILDFPCNQFGRQAPESNDEISKFCELKYKTTFRRFAKIDVNGANADPLFTYLKNESKGFITNAIKWNFTKFLIDKNGNFRHRFSPLVNPSYIEKYIDEIIQSHLN